MADLVPFVLKQEEERVLKYLSSQTLSITFDETSQLGEPLAIIVLFVGEDWTLEQHLIWYKLIATST